MARRFLIPQCTLAALATLVLVLPSVAIAQPASDDAIAASVRQAEQNFRLALIKAKSERTKNIKFVMDREIQRAVATGDLDTLESLKAQLKAYEADGTSPELASTRSHVRRYEQQLTRLGNDLIKAYEDAVRRYTQALDVESARRMQDKIQWTRPTTGLDTTERRGRQYLVVRDSSKSWTEAKAECEKLGGYLVCLNTKAEHEFVFKLVREPKVALWVGATDAKTEGKWEWLDGSTDYLFWHPKEPNNSKGVQHYALIGTGGRMHDAQDRISLVKGYICEWDFLPTRETIYQTEESLKRDSAQIETLQAATLKHNQQIVAERKRLQSAIVAAKDEATLAQAKAGYNDKVASIKKGYIKQLQGGLNRALADDRLDTAGQIKTQILRVEKQLARLSNEKPKPSVPALDDGDADNTPALPPPAIAPEEGEDPSEPEGNDDPNDDAADSGTFFGLPLE